MKRLDLPLDEIRRLHLEEEMSCPEIAERFGCSKGTIQKRLREMDVEIRNYRYREDITKENLEELYLTEGLSTWEIEKVLDCPRSTVHRKLKKFGIPTRSLAESHIIYDREPFSGDPEERAYLIGFVVGDMRTRNVGEKSETVKIDCASTRQEQIELIEDLFSPYGRVWKGETEHRTTGGTKTQIEAHLDLSFSFLLDARERIFSEIDAANFFPFLGGFVDAEGSFHVSGGGPVFSIGNYDREILEFIRDSLSDHDVDCSIYTDKNPRTGPEGYTRNREYHCLTLYRMAEIRELIRLVGPYIRHKKREKDMEEVLELIEDGKEEVLHNDGDRLREL